LRWVALCVGCCPESRTRGELWGENSPGSREDRVRSRRCYLGPEQGELGADLILLGHFLANEGIGIWVARSP
jgi:hypothetical protein